MSANGLSAARSGRGAHRPPDDSWNASARFQKTLGVIGHAPHWIGPDGTPWAYEPYVREMRIWADLFGRIRICSPIGLGPMRGNMAPYLRTNIDWRPVPYPLAPGPTGALRRLLRLPGLMLHSLKTARKTDFVQLRSPGHFGLAGFLCVRALGRRSITKWAGENAAYAGERFPNRLERWLQGVPSERHPVLVYGPPKRSHQIEALPALMTSEELDTSRGLSQARTWQPPWKLLCVGRLDPVKGFDLALRGLGELARRRPELPWSFVLVGDGPAGPSLRKLAQEEGIADRVEFPGAQPFEEVQRRYAAAHVAIMPGTKEGWPKIVAEAWAHGTVPVAARGGLVPWILREPESGVVFDPTPSGLAAALEGLLGSPEIMAASSRAGFRLAREMSLERFRARLEAVLVERCGLA